MGVHRYRLLEGMCLGFAGVGAFAAFLGGTGAFAMWRTGVSEAMFGAPGVVDALRPFSTATLGILGGSIVGKWVAAWWLVRYPLAAGARWAWWALVAGLLGWFCLDGAVSVLHGAWFNILSINLAPLVLVGVPLWRARDGLQSQSRTPLPARGKPLLAATIVFTLFGLVLTFAATAPIFDFYSAAIADAFFEGHAPPQATTWQSFIYGLVGATFAAHFAMLAWACVMAGGRLWVRSMVITSMLAWFCVDSATGLIHGAYFNLLMVNVPSMLVMAAAWWWASSPDPRNPRVRGPDPAPE